MARLLTCAEGHSWEVGPEQGTTCPVCGAAGDTDKSADFMTDYRMIDELPPPPQAGLRHAVAPAAEWPAIPGYEIVGELGRGGMGIVYKARQLSLHRMVALKMIPASLHGTSEALARFRGEAQTIARLKHPNIVHIYDVMEYDGAPCFAMEFVEGGSLEQMLAGKPMAAEPAAQLVRTLARAAQAAHAHGIIHRDLKPANILLATDGAPKITDFGLAKRLDEGGVQTRSGYIMGTPHYMAPEQAEGDATRIGPATDVYGLGAILYEALTGVPPFQGANATSVLKQVLFNEPIAPGQRKADIPPQLDAICLKCLNKDHAKRFPSAAALADALDQFLAPSPNDLAPAAAILPSGPPARISRRTKGTTLALLLIFATTLAFVPEVRRWVFEVFRGGPVVDPPTPIHVQWELLDGPAKEEHEVFDRIAFPTEHIGYVASRSAVYKTLDAGDSWQKMQMDPSGRVHFLHFMDDKNGWLGTDKLQHTSDGGATWNEVALPGVKMRAVTAFAFHPKGWALMGGATDAGMLALFHRPEGQEKWERLALAGDLKAHEKWSLSALTFNEAVGLAVLFDPESGGGVVLRKLPGDAAWKQCLTSDDDLYRVHLSTRGAVWLTGLGGALWHSADGGANFEAHANPDADHATPACIAFDPTGRLGLAPLWKGKLLVKIDSEPWTVQETQLGYSLADAVVVNAGCAVVLGADGRMARFLDGQVKKTQ